MFHISNVVFDTSITRVEISDQSFYWVWEEWLYFINYKSVVIDYTQFQKMCLYFNNLTNFKNKNPTINVANSNLNISKNNLMIHNYFSEVKRLSSSYSSQVQVKLKAIIRIEQFKLKLISRLKLAYSTFSSSNWNKLPGLDNIVLFGWTVMCLGVINVIFLIINLIISSYNIFIFIFVQLLEHGHLRNSV